MKQIAVLFRLASMRRATGAGHTLAATWAVGLLWRNRRAAAPSRSGNVALYCVGLLLTIIVWWL